MAYTIGVSSTEKQKTVSDQTIDKKPKTSMSEWLNSFRDFKRSPILQIINDACEGIPSVQKILDHINQLPEKAKEYVEKKKLDQLALEYQASGVTNKYIKYAGRKLILRDEILSIAGDMHQGTDSERDHLSYLYGKYERLLCDKISKNGVKATKIQYVLYQIYKQNLFQDQIKKEDKNEFIKQCFPCLIYEVELPVFELEFLPLAINIKTNDHSFVQNLWHNKVLDAEEKQTNKAECGGFSKKYREFNVIVELVNDHNLEGNTKTHELFHAEMNLQNTISKQNLAGTDKILTEQIEEWGENSNVSQNLGTFFMKIKDCISEELMAFFSEPNHDFSIKNFEYHFSYYGIKQYSFDELLSENKNLIVEKKATVSITYKLLTDQLISDILELKDALQIMHQKGYPKDWILNSLCSIDDRPVFLENTNPKALAMSLPVYDETKVEKQKKTFEKISVRHQKKLEMLKSSAELPSEFVSDLNTFLFRESFFGQDGIFKSQPQFDFFIAQVRAGLPTGNSTFDNHIESILKQYGDSQATREAVISKLKQMLEEAKERYTIV
jgi:hypothetical protein